MSGLMLFVIVCGLAALAYGWWASRSILAASAGTPRMQEIAAAIQAGASAYLNRQSTTIRLVGVLVTVTLALTLGLTVAVGFVTGPVLSVAPGNIGPHMS